MTPRLITALLADRPLTRGELAQLAAVGFAFAAKDFIKDGRR